MGPPRRAVRCCDVTGRPGPAVTSLSLAEPRFDVWQRPGPARWGRAGAPPRSRSPGGMDSHRYPRGCRAARGTGQRPQRRRGCGLHRAAKIRRRIARIPDFWGCFYPFWGPRRCLLPCGTSPAAARPALAASALRAAPSPPRIIFYCYL